MLVAAGRGERAGGAVPKQFRDVAGVPLLLRALQPFRSHPAVGPIVIVLAADVVAAPPAWLTALLRDSPDTVLVPGGAARADSVRCGLAALPPNCSLVLVHDAARPFVDHALIDRVLEPARRGEAAVPAVRVADTLKRVRSGTSLVERTVPRDDLWRAQTPQGFPRAALEAAHAAPRDPHEPATDDAALVERIGVPVRLVDGSPRNLKITTPDDFDLAACLAGGT